MTSPEPPRTLTPARFALATAVWFIACCVVLLPIWPFLQPERRPWVLLVALGPPLYAIGDRLAARFLARPPDEGGAATRRNSGMRLGFAVVVMLALYAMMLVAARILGLSI